MSDPLPKPEHPDAPKYWAYEESGNLHTAVHRYLQNPSQMTATDIHLMRLYIQQWIDSPVWDLNPHMTPEAAAKLQRLRERVRLCYNVRAIREWIREATEEGMDPL